MRWVERFVNFIGQPESPESIAGCRERFLAEIAATQPASPWLLQEIDGEGFRSHRPEYRNWEIASVT